VNCSFFLCLAACRTRSSAWVTRARLCWIRVERMILGHAAIERIATGCRFTEGPVWFGDLRQLVFSDIPNDRLVRWDRCKGTKRTASKCHYLS
jgi:hypothetical protein